ncbi:unnamed protein product [Taenia asiatica]|uniref:Oxidation resistance protein 1 n=1 Tax=Taenia asiatica TaxID=60517 RepID=A0A0R3WDJ0_TAEAS|nr:unnamed protein product [Taenia asiatica]
MDVALVEASAKGFEKQDCCVVGSGDSSTTVAARFDLAPSRLCQLNELRSRQIFTNQRLKVAKEESEHRKVKEMIADVATPGVIEHSFCVLAKNAVTASPSQEKKFRHIFKRLIGTERLEESHTIRVNQRCVRGTLIAAIETIMFLPLSECEQTDALCQAAIELRYKNIRSVAAYYDASVFAFTKRSRSPRQCIHDFPLEEIKCRILSMDTSSSNIIAPDEEFSNGLAKTVIYRPLKSVVTVISEGQSLEPVLLENEVFLCCTVQRNQMVSGGSTSPTTSTVGAQWFIVSRRRCALTFTQLFQAISIQLGFIEDLENFLINSNLGFTSIIPIESSSHKIMEENKERENERSLNISDALGSLISRRMTLHFRSPKPSIASSQSYISRSLGRLMQRTASARSKADFETATIGDFMGERRRHLSVGCSKELFSDHTAIDVIPDDRKAGDEAESIIACRSSSSTPSFADEKEVFDMLRQSSLAWELVSEQEFLQRCVLAEAEEERVGDREATDSAVVTPLSPPASLLRSCILSTRMQIHELFEAIPTGAQFFDWSLTFSSELHGFSLKTLYRRCEDFVSGDLHANVDSGPCHTAGDAKKMEAVAKHRTLSSMQQNQPCILLIKDTTDCLMGAYLSSHPRLSRGVFYGTGETFVFHWTPSATSLHEGEVLTEGSTAMAPKSGDLCFKKYPWSKKNSFFVSGEPEVLLIGCSNARSALRIDENLNRGRSQVCETFDNPELTPSGDFFIHTIELWSLS